MKAYSKYKESGLKWVGKIPEHWLKKDLNHTHTSERYSFTGGPFGSDLKHNEYTKKGVRIIQLQNIGIGNFIDNYKIYTSEKKADELSSCNIYPGDIIIAKMADPVARACIMPIIADRYLMASDGIRLKVDTQKFSTEFIVYSLNSAYFKYQAELNSTGTTRLRIGLGALRKMKLITPPLTEQKTIANFLDHKTAQIDESISKRKQLIKLLKEERKAIINEAVTKGINPNVKMKDSGIEWIGEIPKHWEVKRFKYWFDLQTKKSETRGKKIGLENVESKTGQFIETNTVFEGDGVDFETNDILYGKLRPYLAKVWLSNIKGSAVGDFFVFRPKRNVDPLFAFNKILDYGFIEITNSSTYGAKMPRVSWEYISNLYMALPEKKEQIQIAEHINTKTSHIDQEIQSAQKEIDLLTEYRQSLITEAVTGKIDVRDYPLN